MKSKIAITMLSSGLSIAAPYAVAACTSSTPLPSASNKGNFLCNGCSPQDPLDGNIFIKSYVNKSIDMWRPNNTVTITNGQQWATYIWTPTSGSIMSMVGSGNGIGPGTQRNHQNGSACSDAQLGQNGGGGSNNLTGMINSSGDYDPFGLYGYRPDLYDYGNQARTGIVTIEQYMSAYYSAYYSEYYRNQAANGW